MLMVTKNRNSLIYLKLTKKFLIDKIKKIVAIIKKPFKYKKKDEK